MAGITSRTMFLSNLLDYWSFLQQGFLRDANQIAVSRKFTKITAKPTKGFVRLYTNFLYNILLSQIIYLCFLFYSVMAEYLQNKITIYSTIFFCSSITNINYVSLPSVYCNDFIVQRDCVFHHNGRLCVPSQWTSMFFPVSASSVMAVTHYWLMVDGVLCISRLFLFPPPSSITFVFLHFSRGQPTAGKNNHPRDWKSSRDFGLKSFGSGFVLVLLAWIIFWWRRKR